MLGSSPVLALLLLPSLALAAKTTDDYLQPYKFVKPLKDLEDLYKAHSSAPLTVAQDRSDDVANLGEEEEKPSKFERKSLLTMSDALEVPELLSGVDEDLPQAQALRDLKGRTRKRVQAPETKARLDNHKTDEEEDTEEEMVGFEEKVEDEVVPDVVAERVGVASKEIVAGPKAEPLRSQPLYPESEYYEYYYYDDEYYEDEPYAPTNRRGSTDSKYPNFPPTKSRQPTKVAPPTTRRPTTRRPTTRRPTTRRPTTRRPTTRRPTRRPTTTRRSTPRPTSRYSKPKSNPYSSKYNNYKKSSSSKSPEYNIKATIERLKKIKRQEELKRNGVPSLPNAWEKMFGSSKSKR